MKLDCVLVACNNNPKYLDFWPLVKEAWWRIASLPCILVYVGENLPEALANDKAVKHFKPILGWPTATQAQCIRLLYPALLKCEGAVMLSDMDMIPMQRNFFVNGFKQFEPTQFVSLRGIDEHDKQIYMCYVGATPKVWSSTFNIENEEDIRSTLTSWSSSQSDGQRGGVGWCTDQIMLYTTVKALQAVNPALVGLIPWTREIKRLDRGEPKGWLEWNDVVMEDIAKTDYVDFHMPPWDLFYPRLMEIMYYRSRNYLE
jgi:hypothetical protein